PLNLAYRGPNVMACAADFRKGDEMGWFEHGSTIVMLGPGTWAFAEAVELGGGVRRGQPLLLRHPVHGIANTQREAAPDRRTEIKRHPGDLILPLGDVMSHDPAQRYVTQPLQMAERSAAIRNFGAPSCQIHRDVDRRQKSEIANDADDR